MMQVLQMVSLACRIARWTGSSTELRSSFALDNGGDRAETLSPFRKPVGGSKEEFCPRSPPSRLLCLGMSQATRTCHVTLEQSLLTNERSPQHEGPLHLATIPIRESTDSFSFRFARNSVGNTPIS